MPDPGTVPVQSELDQPTWGIQHRNLQQYPLLPLGPNPTEQQGTLTTNNDGQGSDSRPFSTVATPTPTYTAVPSGSSRFHSRSFHVPKTQHARHLSLPSRRHVKRTSFHWADEVVSADPALEPAPPIRRMSANQFAELYGRYTSLDVPHAVVFPWLHGVDGDNAAQNLFFGVPPTGMPTPNYRGLTIVRADLPRVGEHVYCSPSEGSVPPRRDSLSSSTTGSFTEPEVEHGSVPDGESTSYQTTSRHNSIASSHSRAQSSVTSMSSGKSTHEHHPKQQYEPQPAHSLLVSSTYPSELLQPCLEGGLEPTFIQPKPSKGVSLRNFGIQCSKYATISDIVLYCSTGMHDGMLRLAQQIHQAQDTLYYQRHQRGLGSLRYNVFVVEGLSSSFPHTRS